MMAPSASTIVNNTGSAPKAWFKTRIKIPTITQNLQKMEWVLPSYTDDTREQFLERRDRIFEELAREFGNP